MAHLTSNYKECNNEQSILHMLIPRGKDGENQKCLMFYPDRTVIKEAKREADELEKYRKAMARENPKQLPHEKTPT